MQVLTEAKWKWWTLNFKMNNVIGLHEEYIFLASHEKVKNVMHICRKTYTKLKLECLFSARMHVLKVVIYINKSMMFPEFF